MSAFNELLAQLQATLGEASEASYVHNDMPTLELDKHQIKQACTILRDDPRFAFDMLIDIAGIDYLTYGCDEWTTQSATYTGFERAVESNQQVRFAPQSQNRRFGIDYQLLSLQHNHRLRLRTFTSLAQEEHNANSMPIIDSICEIWPSANWYEREIFDLYGIIFNNHPDLRRILTDYGFQGYPFRKDFPLIGQVEIRYDATQQCIVYEPVNSVEPRILVPKVIRAELDTDAES